MSVSQEGLPAAPEKKDPTVIGTLWAVGHWVVGRELLMRAASVAVLLFVGAGGIVYAQDAGVKYVSPIREELAAQRKENEEVHKRQALEREQDRRDLATTKLQSAEAMLNVRLIAESLKLRPIILIEPLLDGGSH